ATVTCSLAPSRTRTIETDTEGDDSASASMRATGTTMLALATARAAAAQADDAMHSRARSARVGRDRIGSVAATTIRMPDRCTIESRRPGDAYPGSAGSWACGATTAPPNSPRRRQAHAPSQHLPV